MVIIREELLPNFLLLQFIVSGLSDTDREYPDMGGDDIHAMNGNNTDKLEVSRNIHEIYFYKY